MMSTWTGINKETQNRNIFINTFSDVSMSTNWMASSQLHEGTSRNMQKEALTHNLILKVDQ